MLHKAFDLKDRTSEREKFYISAHYYDSAVHQTDQAISIYEQWKQTYPRDSVPRDNLALIQQSIGQMDKALANALDAMNADPKDPYSYQNTAASYLALGRIDEAKAVAEQSIAQKTDPWSVHMTLFDVAYLRGDESTVQQELQKSAGNPVEPILRWMHSDGYCAQGKVKQAHEEYARAATASKAMGYKEFGSAILASEASCDFQTGFSQDAHQKALALLGRTDDSDWRAFTALLLAGTGEQAKAQQVADELGKLAPLDTMLNRVYIPMIRAMVDLQRNQPAQAISELGSTIPYELGVGPRAVAYTANFIRAQAYLSSHDGVKAAAEFQKILDHRGVDPTNPQYSLAHLGSGRAYALQGDNAKAKAAYQDFFAVWKDADPDVPILKTAKAEYAKLQ